VGAMGPWVSLRRPSGGEVLLRPGDLIGRHWRCALELSDERISEAHAMVSLRGRSLRLLALRGGIAVEGVVVSDPVLEPGCTFELAPGLAFTVQQVHLPSDVLALAGEGLDTTSLAGTMSLFLDPPRRLVPGYQASADAWLFDDGQRWFATVGEQRHGPLSEGDTLAIGDWRATFVRIAPEGIPATQAGFDASDPPLRIEAWHDVVRVFRGAELVVQVGGRKGRLMSELAAIGSPVDWAAVAAMIWPDQDDRWALRKRWDTTVRRLRRMLVDEGLRADLIASDGTGCFSLVLRPGDEVVVRD